MPRRIYTYQPGRGLELSNLIASIGVIFQALGDDRLRLLNVVKSLMSGKAAGKDPWDAWTLEWSTFRRRRNTISRMSRLCIAAVPCGI